MTGSHPFELAHLLTQMSDGTIMADILTFRSVSDYGLILDPCFTWFY